MALKIYREGNYIYLVDEANKIYEGKASGVIIVKSELSSTTFGLRGLKGWHKTIDLSNITDKNGVPYTASTWEVFYTVNTARQTLGDYYSEVMKGSYKDEFIVNKFGRNGAVGTSLTHVSISGVYQTPTTAQSLELLSSNAADGVAGAGARKVLVEGLDSNFDLQQEEVIMDGLTPVALTNQFIRVFRMTVSESGSYVTISVPSHVGQITLRGAGVGATWVVIDTIEEATTGFGIGQSQIGTYTVPRGYTAFLLSKTFSVESNKSARIYFFKREKADDVAVPYTGIMRLFEQNDGISGLASIHAKAPLNVITEMSEVGFFALAAVASASISVEFQLHLIKNK